MRGAIPLTLIVAYMRGGSTFTADVMKQAPGTHYLYEPLHDLIVRYEEGRTHHLYERDRIVSNIGVVHSELWWTMSNVVSLHWVLWSSGFRGKRKRSDSVLWQKPLHQQKCQKGKMTTQTTPQKSSIYTAVADRLRTVSWSNYSHPTGVVILFTGPPSH